MQALKALWNSAEESSRRMAGHHYLFMSTEAAKFEYECSLNGLE